MSPSQSEFTVLRQTIAVRGTVRMALLPVTVIGWTSITVALLHGGLTLQPMLSLVSLSVLIGGFEAIHALNVGVERIGRYLQVYYEANRRRANLGNHRNGRRPGSARRWNRPVVHGRVLRTGRAQPGAGIS